MPLIQYHVRQICFRLIGLHNLELWYTHNLFQDWSNLQSILQPSGCVQWDWYLTIRRTILWVESPLPSPACLRYVPNQPTFHLAGRYPPQQNIFSGYIFLPSRTIQFGVFSKIYFLLNGYSVTQGIKMIKQKQILEVMWGKHNRYFKYLTLASY